jgi:hypothetical protein
MKTIRILTGLLLLAGRAQGETWADWMGAPEGAPLAAEFHPGWAVEASQKYSTTRTEEFVEPNRGYDGELVFTPAPGAEPPDGPLAIRLRHVVVPPAGINWPEGDIPTNFVAQPLASVAPGRTVAEETRMAAAEFPLRIPVVRPRSCVSPVSWRSRKAAALFGAYEVRDAAGVVVARGLLPARRLSESTRALVGMAEDDEALKQVTERSGTIERVSDLPEDMEAYRQVRAIWFTEALWEQMAGREALGRRLLLSGVRLTGETALVERIQAALGTGWKGRAVAESAVPSQLSSKSLYSLRSLNLEQMTCENEGGTSRREVSVLGNEASLFASDRDAYLTWTLAGLLVFAAGVVAILAMVFIRHKGERRVAIWWALPAWAVVCATALWVGGRLVLDRRSRADVTEYRLMMAGWPEMHVRVVASAMTFEPGRPQWALPPEAVLHGQRYDRLDGWWAQQDEEISPMGIPMRLLRLPRKPTGSTLEVEAGWFEAASTPVALEDGTPEAPGRWAVALENVDGAYVLAEGRWRDLGPMKAGERVDPLSAAVREPNRLPGLPDELHDGLSGWHWREPCRNPAHHHPPEHGLPPKHDWVVVAWRRDVPPRVAPVWAESRTEGRVIWVVQWP